MTYNNSTRAIIEHYEHEGLVHQLDASGTPDEVSSSLSLLTLCPIKT